MIEQDGRIVGFAIGNAQSGNVWALFVEPSCEGLGGGRLLHDTMLDWLSSLGLRRAWLTTAPRTRAQGVGVDIEPYWIEQSRANAAAAGVEDRVHFAHCDALEADLDTAIVVFLYLVEWSTRLMAGELRKRCAPGTRVLSLLSRSRPSKARTARPWSMHPARAGPCTCGWFRVPESA